MAQQSHYQAINSVQMIVQQLHIQQFGGVYFDQTQAQAQAVLALNLLSICGSEDEEFIIQMHHGGIQIHLPDVAATKLDLPITIATVESTSPPL
uniref:Uncharacterized protein n=1 Tax=Oryza punctata TaxID=4537 RepID=A0A0E0LII6_ORYPU